VHIRRAWASDCGAVSKYGFDEDLYFAQIQRLEPWAATCHFLVVPDVIQDAEATLNVFTHYARELDATPLPLAYVLQDGAENEEFPAGAQVAFLGGSDPWRRRWGAMLLARAHEEGLRTHVGRVNSAQRVQALSFTHADSCDGTYVAFRSVKRGLREIGEWLDRAAAPALFSANDFPYPPEGT
jgi:hypothetical protein